MVEHLLGVVPWIAALVVSLGFRKVLFKDWSEFFDCLRSWLRSVAAWLFLRRDLQSLAEVRDGAEPVKLALLGAAGLIGGLITRALLVGAGLI